MKINITVESNPADGSADEKVLQTLRDIGFTDETTADGSASLVYDGDISPNDLAYGASMAKSLISGRK